MRTDCHRVNYRLPAGDKSSLQMARKSADPLTLLIGLQQVKGMPFAQKQAAVFGDGATGVPMGRRIFFLSGSLISLLTSKRGYWLARTFVTISSSIG